MVRDIDRVNAGGQDSRFSTEFQGVKVITFTWIIWDRYRMDIIVGIGMVEWMD